jgi:hypothetical protein
MNTESALKAKEFVFVTENDVDGKPITAFCPGHKCKVYCIKIDRKQDGVCLQCDEVRAFDPTDQNWKNETKPCSGSMFGGVCYHALAVMLSITEKHGEVRFFHDQKEATDAKKETDRIIPIWSISKPEKYIWLVFSPKKKSLKKNKEEPGQPPPENVS